MRASNPRQALRSALVPLCVAALAFCGMCDIARAHFLVLLPSTDVVSSPAERELDVHLEFTHPMEQGPRMQMETPRRFDMIVGGKSYDLRSALRPNVIDGRQAFDATIQLKRPGDHILLVEPEPYWEPAEGKMIVHYTKVVVDFLGAEDGWDTLVGLPVEIEPLVRPYGLWTGNTFRGVVRRDGRPVSFAEVEVEYWNEGLRVTPPNGAFVTQVVKADANGVFSYTIPKAGWWGFAALVDGDKPMPNPDGEPADVELGGLIWVKAVDMKDDAPTEN